MKGRRQLADRALHRAVPTRVLVVTDLDPDGLRIYQSAAEDAVAWATPNDHDRGDDVLTGDVWTLYRSMLGDDAAALLTPGGDARQEEHLRFERIAVTREQAQAAGVLDDDGKAEADALLVPILDAILRGHLDALLDPAARESLQAVQDRERARLPDVIAAALTRDDDPPGW